MPAVSRPAHGPMTALGNLLMALRREQVTQPDSPDHCSNVTRHRRLPNEVAQETHRQHCTRLIGARLLEGATDLADLVQGADKYLHKWTEPLSMKKKWSRNFGNAMHCYADYYSLRTLCGVEPIRRLTMFGAADGDEGIRSLVRSPSLPSDDTPLRPFSRGCLSALYCRRPHGTAKGACWGAFGYAHVLPALRSQFHNLLPAQLPMAGRSRPCGEPRGVGVVYMRCGDYLTVHQGHIMLRLDWLDGFAKAALAGVGHVIILSNQNSHGPTWAAPVCAAVISRMRRRLQRLLAPNGPHVSVRAEQSILQDLHCMTHAEVLIVASWGSSFGHWVSLLNTGCTVVMPYLRGVGSRDVGGKHLAPIAWRDGLHYVAARREQWVHVPDHNQSIWKDPHAVLKLLSPPVT